MSRARDSGELFLVTGGAGFIGSHIVRDLAQRGARVVVCDLMRAGEKWRNLASAPLHDLIRPEALFDLLARCGERLSAIVHMGAISSTTEIDIDRLVAANIRLTIDLWEWCAANRVRLLYASSAATYGNGEAGFADDDSPQGLARLKPLNAYGWSKHLVDRRIAADVAAGRPVPPQWAALKFFNVYGPGEAHKGPMQSVASKILPVVEAGGAVTLFKSHDPRYPDGGQLRDFVYVEDCVAIVRWLLANPGTSGLFNAGSGKARSFADLVAAVGAALGREAQIRYVDTPAEIRDKYQYFTEADMTKLRRAGFTQPMHSLEEGVRDFVLRARGGGQFTR
jgi:ADP-L-glycero-D-manno-heptose 6-epimerase